MLPPGGLHAHSDVVMLTLGSFSGCARRRGACSRK